jgi:thioredoxin-related protein
MRIRASITAFALLAAGMIPSSHAARQSAGAAPPRLELLVLEIESCVYCPMVRDLVRRRYEATPLARTAPMRFVDVTRTDETKLGLEAPIDTAPTIVLLRDGREIHRFSGYMGPDLFIATVGHVLRQEGE